MWLPEGGDREFPLERTWLIVRDICIRVLWARHRHCHRFARIDFKPARPVAGGISIICVPPARRMPGTLVFKTNDRRAASGPGCSAVSRPVLVLHDGTARSRLGTDGPHRSPCVVRCHNMDRGVMTGHGGRNTSVIKRHRSLVLLRSTSDDTLIVH